MQDSKTVVVIGAGIVGVSTAIWLQREGHKVVIVDRKGPAEGTSYGNGGILASCSIVPVTGPGLLAKAPKMLFSPNQPLFLKWGYLPKLLPWLTKYLSHANADDTRRIAQALTPIVGDSLQDHLALAEGTGAEHWIVPTDYIFAYNDRAHYGTDAFGWGLRKQNGFQWDELEGQAFREFDDVYSPDLGFAARLKDHGRIRDPGQYIKDLADHFVAQGGKLIIADVEDIAHENGQVTGVRAGGETISCDTAVVALGVWSGPLAKKLGIDIPLEAERGYHLEFWEPSVMPKTPVMVAAYKFVATPMEGRLRLAGTVEFGGLEAGPSEAPLNLLRRNAAAVFPGLRASHVTEWLGHRPAPVDSIPVIGELPHLKGAFTGFGHHHVGLTGGPKTGRILAQLISGKAPNIDLSIYSPARYTKAG